MGPQRAAGTFDSAGLSTTCSRPDHGGLILTLYVDRNIQISEDLMQRNFAGALLIAGLASVLALGQHGAPVIDGVTHLDEYHYIYRNNEIGMWLFWSVIGDTIYISMRAPATGWLGLNFMPMDGTIHGDTVIGYVEPQGDAFSVKLSDQVAPGDGHFPHYEDVKLGGTESVLDAAGSEIGGVTTIEFTRKLMTGEETDAMFMDDVLMTMISFHPTADDYISYHDSWYSVVTINYLRGYVNDFPTDLTHVETHDH
jgi:hypothetical protein